MTLIYFVRPKGCPTETMAHRAGAVRSCLGAQPLQFWASSSVVGIGRHEVPLVDELTLSHVLAPFGCLDWKRDGFETLTPMGGAECVNKSLTELGLQTARESSSLPSTASAVSSLPGIPGAHEDSHALSRDAPKRLSTTISHHTGVWPWFFLRVASLLRQPGLHWTSFDLLTVWEGRIVLKTFGTMLRCAAVHPRRRIFARCLGATPRSSSSSQSSISFHLCGGFQERRPVGSACAARSSMVIVNWRSGANAEFSSVSQTKVAPGMLRRKSSPLKPMFNGLFFYLRNGMEPEAPSI